MDWEDESVKVDPSFETLFGVQLDDMEPIFNASEIPVFSPQPLWLKAIVVGRVSVCPSVRLVSAIESRVLFNCF